MIGLDGRWIKRKNKESQTRKASRGNVNFKEIRYFSSSTVEHLFGKNENKMKT